MLARCLVLAALVLGLFGCNRRSDFSKPRRARPPAQDVADYILQAAPPISHPLDIAFDDQVWLLGYDVEPNGAVPRSKEITLTLYWTLTEKLTGSWKLLTQVLDPYGGKVVDLYNAGPLRVGRRGHPRLPPSRWSVGKIYVDKLSFTLPSRLAARQLRVVAGVYSRGSLEMGVTKGPHASEGRALVATLDVAVENPGITVTKLRPNARIDIDGDLSEAAWNHAPVLGPFLEVDYDGLPHASSQAARQARMLWDAGGLYLGYEVADGDVQGGVPVDAPEPDLSKNDAVILVVDPDGDGHGDYELQINPRNLTLASRRATEPGVAREAAHGTRKDWTAQAKTAVTVNGTLDRGGDRDAGYVVEAMIPWHSFDRDARRPPTPGTTWRMNLYAVDKGTARGWSPSFAKDDFRKASRFGTVLFQ
jgi:hypothetical protein